METLINFRCGECDKESSGCYNLQKPWKHQCLHCGKFVAEGDGRGVVNGVAMNIKEPDYVALLTNILDAHDCSDPNYMDKVQADTDALVRSWGISDQGKLVATLAAVKNNRSPVVFDWVNFENEAVQ